MHDDKLQHSLPVTTKRNSIILFMAMNEFDVPASGRDGQLAGEC